jgi:HK97 family phage prohead protease
MKIRNGGLNIKELEQRVLDGNLTALRPLVRQLSGLNTLTMPFNEGTEIRVAPDGTGGSRLLFTGYASIIESPYTMQDWYGPYEEVIRGGAFTKTLAENPDVVFCLNHDWMAAPMARTTAGTCRLSEDATGLHVEADLDPKRSDVYILQSCMEAGELDAMSFAFYVVRQTWSPDYEQRDIKEVDLDGGDVSEVTHPANPATGGTTALRAAAGRAIARSSIPRLIVERARVEKRAGATLSAATMSTLQEVLDLVAEADVAVDVAQELLSELMGVENPNADDTSSADDDTPEGETLNASDGPDPALVRERLRLVQAARRR